MQQPLAYIPSPSQNAVHLGPIPLRGYALMIILGVIVAVWLGERRWTARGGVAGTVVDIAVWAVPFGLVGGRLYHVITDHQLYFGHGRHPIDALKVWNGGLGIWGAVALGALGAYLGARRRGISMRAFADAAAPGVVLAQAIGRWGNWFNQELYGRPTKLPWAVEIDPAHRPMATPTIGTYHPTFLYESLWCIGVAVLVIWAEKRFRLAYGRTFALYVAAYTVGRAWIEWLRVDPAHHVLGLRLNDWTSMVVFLAAAGYLYAYRSRTENPPGAFGTVAAETGAVETGAAATEPSAVGAVDAAESGTAESGTAETAETAGSEGSGSETPALDTGEASGDAGTAGSEPGDAGSGAAETENGATGAADAAGAAGTDRKPADDDGTPATAGGDATAARNGAGTAASTDAAANGTAGTAAGTEADATAGEEPPAPVGTGTESSADAGKVGKDS